MIPDRPSWRSWKITLDFILDHPRRVCTKRPFLEILQLTGFQVYTNLFPARHSWYLLATIIILNGIDWAGFELLAIGNKEIEKLPAGYRVLDGLFQALGLCPS